MHWKTLSNLSRFKDIAVVLFRYGFDDLLQRLLHGFHDLRAGHGDRSGKAGDEVAATHVGLGFSPEVWEIVATRLHARSAT